MPRAKDYGLKEITVNMGMTLNVGNYESFRVDTLVTLKANREVTDEQDFEDLKNEMLKDAWKIAKAEITTKVKEVREKTKAKDGDGF